MARKHRSKSRPHRRPVPQNAKPVALQQWRERIDKPLEISDLCGAHRRRCWPAGRALVLK